MSPIVRAGGLVAIALALSCRPGDVETAPDGDEAEPAHAPEPSTPAEPAAASTREEQIERALAEIDAASLRADVEALASDDLQGRATPSPGLDAAAAHIVARVRAIELEAPAGLADHRQIFPCGGEARPGPAANVLAQAPGRTEERVLVSAHYDHIGVRDGRGDGVFNGANDDASGVAAALAIVGAVGRLDPPPRRAVLFAAFCGEEIGLRGSKHFVAEPPVPLDSIVAGVNLEMLGRPSRDAPARVWITGLPLSTLSESFVTANAATGVTFVDGLVIGAQEGDAFDRADNYPLARAGIVAHSLSTGRIDELYHSADDEAGTLDYDAMVPLVRGIARGVIALAEADSPPSWTAAGTAAGYGAAGVLP